MPAAQLIRPLGFGVQPVPEIEPPSQVRLRAPLSECGAEDCLRLVVLGAAFGRGANRGLLDKLYVGGRRSGGATESSTSFHPIGVVTRGMEDVLASQTRLLLEREVWRDANMVHLAPELVVEVSTRGSRWRGGALSAMRLVTYLEGATLDEVDDVSLIEERLGSRALQLSC